MVQRRNVRRTSSMSPQSQAHGTPMKGVESYPYKVNERLYKDDVCAPTPFASSLPAPFRKTPAHLASSLPAPCHEPRRQPGTARAYDVAAPSFKCPLTSARASGRRHDPHRHCSAHMLRTDKRLWRVAAVQGRRCQPPDPPIPLHVQPLRITPVQCAQQLRRERFDQPVADY